MERYPLFGEKSKALTYLSGVRDVGQLEKTVRDGRWTWIKGRKRKKTKLSLLLMVFDSSELKSKFAYHFKQILFSSWRYRQNFAKKQKQRKYSMITGQQNRKKMGVFGQKWMVVKWCTGGQMEGGKYSSGRGVGDLLWSEKAPEFWTKNL